MRAVRSLFVLLSLGAALGLPAAATPDSAGPIWWSDYRAAMAQLEADDAESAEQLLHRALKQRPHPSRRSPVEAGQAPYVPYLQMTRVYLRRGNLEDAELSLTISATFEAYRDHRPSRELFRTLTDAIEQAHLTQNGAAETAPSSSPR